MKSKSKITKHVETLFFCIIFSCLFLFSCEEKPPIQNVNIKIIFSDFPSNICDESGKLSDEARALFGGLENDNNKCKYTYVLTPTLIRSDLGLDTSITTVIEKSAIAAPTPTRVIKLIQMHLDEVTIPSRLIQKSASKVKSDSLFNKYLSLGMGKDSLIVFKENPKEDSIIINKKQYKIFKSIGDIKNKILLILCQDPKATISLLINPPNQNSINEINDKVVVIGAKVVQPNIKPQTHSVGRLNIRTKNYPASNGDLNMIKGSEGCEICTRYYSAIDNLGQTRHVTEKNSTFCCPCGKTIEMKGRSYRMECDGSGNNRLALIE